MTTPAPTDTRVQRHPIRGFVFGTFVGLSVAIYLVLFSVTPFRIATLVAVVVIGGLLGALWGSVAPAKKLTAVPPTTAAFGTTYVSSGDVDRGPSPTYEDTFGRPQPVDDDGSFGATDDTTPPPGAEDPLAGAATPAPTDP